MIYVHAPFCLSKCYYCDFNSYTGMERLIDPYVKALIKEMESTEIGGPAGSVFVGGGNPLNLGTENLGGILETIRNKFALAEDAEITVEANPESAHVKSLESLAAAGVNRVSIGLQSLDDRILRTLGRRHTAADNYLAFRAAREAGYESINVDLIFSVPGQSPESWRETLDGVLGLKPEHVSAYCLTVERGTPLKRLIDRNKLRMPDNETAAEMMESAAGKMDADGYRRYEVSNYALPGYECRHNLNYWRGGNYLGFGAGAHSHLDGRRWSNKTGVREYIEAIEGKGFAAAAIEELTVEDKILETIFLGLRTGRGISAVEIKEKYGLDISDKYGNELRMLEDEGLADIGERIVLTKKGLMLADAVTELFM